MNFINRIVIILSILIFYTGNNIAYAQLWRYLNDSPANRKAEDLELKKEASSVITKKTVAYGDTFSYDIMTFNIQSFDDHPAEIRLWEKPFDGHVFHIDIPNDSLAIQDFYCLTRVHHLSNYLLEIVYSPRGGSDQGYDNVLLLGVDKGKLCIAMELLSVNEFQGPGEYGLYNLHLKLSGNNVNSYKLAIHVRDLLKADSSQKSFDKSTNFVLKFDNKLHVFYNGFKSINAVADVFDDNEGKNKPQHLKGKYPIIKLDKEEYLFLKGLWYSVGKNISTTKYFFSGYSYRPKTKG